MLNGNAVLPGASLPAFLTLFACFPIYCTPSPLTLSTNPPDKNLGIESTARSNDNAAVLPLGNTNELAETDVDGGNPWQELFWEEEQVRSKKEAGSVGSVEDFNKVMDNKPKLTTTTTTPKPKEKVDMNAINVEYVCNEESKDDQGGCRSPLLKHYKMYTVDPEDDFYPGWTYHGFHSPNEWHQVPIDLFERPPPESVNRSQNHFVRKHGSAMHLCSDQPWLNNNTDTAICKDRMENECINSFPSPINIIKRLTVEDPTLTEITFVNYNVYFGFEMFFETDGTQLLFVKFLPHKKDGRRPGIRHGPLGRYQELHLDRIIIRYGVNQRTGSEHSINGEYFGMELQFFFTADERPYWQILSGYKTLAEDDPIIGESVHVVSIFANVADIDKEVSASSDYLGDSMDILANAAEKFWEGQNDQHFSKVRVDKKVLTLEDFFNEPKSGVYYTYQGSLSHPPCLSNVTWTVFEKPIWVSHAAWRKFAYVHSEYSDYRFLAGNIRPHNSILVKADIKMFREMKFVQGFGELHQRELDEAADNLREIETQNGTNKADLFLIRSYVDYQKYFAKRVRRSKRPLGNSSNSLTNEYDYYEDEKEAMNQRSLKDSSSGVASISFYSSGSGITMLTIFMLIKVIRSI